MKIYILRFVSAFLIFNIILETFAPLMLFALTTGPSQPEVNSFTPVNSTEMVNLFTGDFNYNIPLLDVDAYPVNISYQSGITMEQEASWTGLGWNINAGSVNRTLRGLPDDFNGDMITKKMNLRPSKTYGVNIGGGVEFFGKTKIKPGFKNSIGIRYNNYSGMGVEKNVHLGLSASLGAKTYMNYGIGISSSSDNGLNVQPSIGLGLLEFHNKNLESSLGVHLGTSFNSRAGLKNFTLTGYFNPAYNSIGKLNGKNFDQQLSSSHSLNATYNFGTITYTPQIQFPMVNYSETGTYKLGKSYTAVFPNASVGAYYSVQSLSTHEISNPGFGYMNLDAGQNLRHALLDFNREKDVPYSNNTTDLAIPNLTFDIFSVAAQGDAGSFRAFRSDNGHVFDSEVITTSEGNSFGNDIGIGNILHAGIEFNETNVYSSTGDWTDDNYAGKFLSFKEKTNEPLYEKYYFKEAGEKSILSDPDFFTDWGGKSPVRNVLLKNASFSILAIDKWADKNGAILKRPELNSRKERDIRNKLITTLNYNEVKTSGLNAYTSNYAKDHHIAEINSQGSDGSRYVYGLPVYNISQQEVSFAVGDNQYSKQKGRIHDVVTGLVSYNKEDDGLKNQMGLDNYYSNTILPSYAYAYLLTAVLSPDYIDSDNIRGPSDLDMGKYTAFSYKRIDNFKWRSPLGELQASHQEGLKTDPYDDKANYIYGQKEMYYLEKITTKNHIAIFHTSNRDDGCGVKDADGKIDGSLRSQKLDSICLYVKDEYYNKRINGNYPIAIKKVHFEYDYSLCPKVPNNINGGGKLTLKKIYFSYANSNKARFSPYEFHYHTFNPSYNQKGYDRWGNYKNNDLADESVMGDFKNIPTSEFSYTFQDKASADLYASSWSLEKIYLPSGGIIQVKMESDDYAYVQNKKAMQMFTILGTEGNHTSQKQSISSENTKLYFKGTPGTHASDYFSGIDKMYFRFLMELTPDHHEYVSGYSSILKYDFDSNTGIGWVQLKPAEIGYGEKLKIEINPISKAAIQYLRLNRPKWAYGEEIDGEPGLGKDLIEAMINSSFTKNITEALTGPENLIMLKGYCKRAVLTKSWIRLNNPINRKYGGGARVAEIKMFDSWSDMTKGMENTSEYGMTYEYSLDDGTSSGVASYEPIAGGDENPLKKPVYFTEENVLAPDDVHYLEEPFGESFFPYPSIGYSKVTVKNLQYNNVKRHATGKKVYEFYTTKEFPVITDRTTVDQRHEKSNPFSLQSLFQMKVKDYLTVSQGYSVELNDMHGKAKAEKYFKEGVNEPYMSVEYKYKSKAYNNDGFRLDNTVTVMNREGEIKTAELGVFSEFVNDMREYSTNVLSTTISPNLDLFSLFGYPVFLVLVWPSEASEKTRFRSAVSCKLIQKSAILEETIVFKEGAINRTKVIAFDSESGRDIVSKTNTDFNDDVYTLKYPAYWYYNDMGHAFKNTGYKTAIKCNANSVFILPEADKFFTEGDELLLDDGKMQIQAWVIKLNYQTVNIADKFGKHIPSGNYMAKIVKSGRKNQVSSDMAVVQSLSNPLQNIQSNAFDKILHANAVEYDNKKKTFCDCNPNSKLESFSSNPFINGTNGSWKPVKSYTHLANRIQKLENENVDTRNDGVLTSYSPFYKLKNSNWYKDASNWTYTSELTSAVPDIEYESKDPSGIYNSVVYGYKQSLPLAISHNAMLKEIGFDSFEDYHFLNCRDNHFKFNSFANALTTSESHTGRSSIKVTSSNPVSMYKALKEDCAALCNPEFYVGNNEITSNSIGVKNVASPIVFHWNILYGTPDLQMSNSSNSNTAILKFTQKNWEADIYVTDSNGCTAKKRFSF